MVRDCAAAPKCPVCVDLGRPANWLGSRGCAPPPSRRWREGRNAAAAPAAAAAAPAALTQPRESQPTSSAGDPPPTSLASAVEEGGSGRGEAMVQIIKLTQGPFKVKIYKPWVPGNCSNTKLSSGVLEMKVLSLVMVTLGLEISVGICASEVVASEFVRMSEAGTLLESTACLILVLLTSSEMGSMKESSITQTVSS
ncbi:hypothetical protein WN55_05461 [Dufourea novaeangliae]|uniref:Uncharacterized protein n=1 Tax=Dufourea novaeangliae TaxID=178035 RepID=A0A154PMG1_DUFNO|nr:hypothetical protein WN55_05461 [Dufourea novaeangliae]